MEEGEVCRKRDRRLLADRLRAIRQHAWAHGGLLTTGNLEAAGLGNRKALHRLVARGLLAPVHPRVWRLPDVRPTEQMFLRAASLWADGGAIVGESAARLHRLEGVCREGPVHVAGAKSRSSAPSGVHVHRLSGLHPRALTVVDGILVTTVERTLLDLAELTRDPQTVQCALESAWRHGTVQPTRLLKAMGDAPRPGKRGKDLLRELLLDSVRRRRPLGSPLEVRLWRGLARAGLPPPEVQVELRDEWGHPLFPDFVYLGERLVVEALGRAAHAHPAAFEKDAQRTARLTAMGFSVLGVTSQMLDQNEDRVFAWIAESLRRRRGFARAVVIHDETVAPAQAAAVARALRR